MKDQKGKAVEENKPEAPLVKDLRKRLLQKVNQENMQNKVVANNKALSENNTQLPSDILNNQKAEKNNLVSETNKKQNLPEPSKEEPKVKENAPAEKPPIDVSDLKSFSENFHSPLPLLKKLNSRRCLALDIDVDKIRYIIAKKSGELIQVESWGIQKFPEEISHRFRALQITMEHLKQKLYKSGTEVRVSIFSTDFIIRQEVFPFLKKKSELEHAIFFKFRDEIKYFKDEKFVWGYDVLGDFEEEGIKKIRVQVVFAPWEAINRYVYIFDHLKLPVEQLIPRPAALIAAYDRMVEIPKSDLLINISYDFTQILYLKGGNLEYIRNLGIGSRNLEFTIRNDSGNIAMPDATEPLEPDQATGNEESILRKRLKEKLKALKTKQNPVLHTFFSEILRSIAFIQGSDRHNFIDRILLTGYGIQKESLVPYLKNRLNIPIFVIFPRLADRPLNEQLKFGEFFTTIGTILQKHDGFNLLPKKFKERTSYRKLGRWLYFVIFLTTLIAGYMSFAQYQLYKKQSALVQGKEKEYITLNPFEQSYKQLLQLIGNLKRQNESLKSQVEARPPLLEMMRLFSNITPENIRFNAMVFRKLESGGKLANEEVLKDMPKYAVTIEGEILGDFVNGDVTLINFINTLDNLKFFKDIRLDHKERDQEKKVITFGLTMKF